MKYKINKSWFLRIVANGEHQMNRNWNVMTYENESHWFTQIMKEYNQLPRENSIIARQTAMMADLSRVGDILFSTSTINFRPVLSISGNCRAPLNIFFFLYNYSFLFFGFLFFLFLDAATQFVVGICPSVRLPVRLLIYSTMVEVDRKAALKV